MNSRIKNTILAALICSLATQSVQAGFFSRITLGGLTSTAIYLLVSTLRKTAITRKGGLLAATAGVFAGVLWDRFKDKSDEQAQNDRDRAQVERMRLSHDIFNYKNFTNTTIQLVRNLLGLDRPSYSSEDHRRILHFLAGSTIDSHIKQKTMQIIYCYFLHEQSSLKEVRELGNQINELLTTHESFWNHVHNLHTDGDTNQAQEKCMEKAVSKIQTMDVLPALQEYRNTLAEFLARQKKSILKTIYGGK